MVIGPWRHTKSTPLWKQRRADDLDAEFEKEYKENTRTAAWSKYVSLRTCVNAEKIDGSHFTAAGAATILDTTLKSEIMKFLMDE